MTDAIPYGRQDIDADDIAAVEAVLRSDWLTQGPAIERFERCVADYVGAKFACAVNSATSALHLAARAVGLGTGDVLWTVPNTFVASANAALYCGAKVDFVDIDPQSCNLSVDALANKLAAAERENRLPKALVAVHFAGLSCDMARIAELAQRYRFRVIEDAAHAIGGDYHGQKIGNCAYSDIAVFSFHPVKIITSAEGGMLVTNDPALHQAVSLLRSHGVTRDPALMDRVAEGDWYYQQVDLGFNYRLTDIHAALGLSQMRRIDEFVARRRDLADRYDRLLADLPVIRAPRDTKANSAWHLYVIQIDQQRTNKSRKEVFDAMRRARILVNVHYIPVHLQPYYRGFGFAPGDYPAAEAYYDNAITLPLYAAMSDEQQDRVAAALKDALA
ncbi:MAG TPA: UDP-4-amino-4,6-dideoxy-N-acetyl-beta-L-altrosamine transaminase [Stellaceae bacterium]|jgi:UDP-4-amino-4,6-dideoxy-N-acetyl-beta-L-altrosamine transaminase|nr:UDP-4-amino-4,6-dideoxy-N-acetyl-beta-L-altrosamine transaminase [Stellaceae bacterium]